MPPQVRIILFRCCLSISVLQPVSPLPVCAQLEALAVLRESSSPQCGDATSFSSHYVLIRERYRGGGGEDQKQTQRCTTELHTVVAQDFPEMKGVRVQRGSKETLQRPVHFLLADMHAVAKNNLTYCELLLFVAMSTEICKHLFIPHN